MNKIKLSIIIPLYNAEKTINECLNSILAYDKDDIEILLINDGSKDNSRTICNNYKNNDSRIIVLSQSNHGVSFSRNNGIEHARGKYIMFVDADDYLDSDWFDILDYLKDNKDYYLFSEKLDVTSSTEKVLSYIVGNNRENIVFSGPFSKIIKRQFILENNIRFNEKLINGEDMLFNISILAKSCDHKIINNSFYNYRNIIGSATKKFNYDIFESDSVFHNELEQVMKLSVFNENIIMDTMTYCKQMAIIMICSRLSFCSKYNETRKYFVKLRSIFCNIKDNEIILNKNSYKIIVRLVYYRLYFVVYFIMKFKNSISYKKNMSSYFTKI